MGNPRLIWYLIGMVFFFSLFGLVAYLFFPAFRDGGATLLGVILTQITAITIGLGAREIVSSEIRKRGEE